MHHHQYVLSSDELLLHDVSLSSTFSVASSLRESSVLPSAESLRHVTSSPCSCAP